jgi:hypothetical protein
MTGALVLAVLVGSGALVALLVRSVERTLGRSYEVAEESAPARRRRSSAPPPGVARHRQGAPRTVGPVERGLRVSARR